MDALFGLSVILLLITFGVIGGFIAKLWWDEEKAARRRREILAGGTPNGETADAAENEVHRPQRRRRMNVQEPEPRAREEDSSDHHQQSAADDSDDADGGDGKPKKIGAKKLAKLQAKAETKAKREAEQAERAERRKQEEQKANVEAERRRAEEEEERQRQEKLRLEREEKKRREQEEYNKLKAAFSVEELGFDRDEADEDGENLMHTFLEYIRSTKVVYLDDLAARFSVLVEECIERINLFMADGLLSGVMDDRGKFICITSDELDAAKFINKRGRVSVQELVDYSNRLISLEPTGRAATSTAVA